VERIQGLQKTLKQLQQIDPVLKREAIKHLKSDLQPVVTEIKSALPNLPLSNWKAPKQASARNGKNAAGRSGQAGTPYWVYGKAKRGVTSSVKKQRVKGFGGMETLISIRQNNAAGEVFDMAGRTNPSVFARNLDKWGKPSRRMWPTVERHKPDIVKSIRAGTLDMEKLINEALRDKGKTGRRRPRGSKHFR
jgi:hypothetical protein